MLKSVIQTKIVCDRYETDWPPLAKVGADFAKISEVQDFPPNSYWCIPPQDGSKDAEILEASCAYLNQYTETDDAAAHLAAADIYNFIAGIYEARGYWEAAMHCVDESVWPSSR